jgi:hypothetical protein
MQKQAALSVILVMIILTLPGWAKAYTAARESDSTLARAKERRIKTGHVTYDYWVLPKGTNVNAARGADLYASATPTGQPIPAMPCPESVLEQASWNAPAPDAGAGTEPHVKENSYGYAAGASAVARAKSYPKRAQPEGWDSAAGSDPAPQKEAAPKVPGGMLEGIYVGFGLDHSHVGSRQYYFTIDGWVINNIPLVNMDNFDMTGYRKNASNKLFIGRYRVDGHQIHIVWANNADRREVIKYDEDAAEPGIDTYIPTCRCTGKRFSGKYHWSSPTDKRYVQFFPDGTFFDHGLTDQVIDRNPHGYRGITDPPRNFRGTYDVRNQRLTFRFADGKHSTVAFIAPKALEKAPAFKWIGLGHRTGVSDAETVIVLMLYEEHYQVQP